MSNKLEQNSRVYMVKTLEPDETQTAIDFRDQNRRRQGGMSYYDGDNVIWSCRFSADGNEVCGYFPESLHGPVLTACLTRLSQVDRVRYMVIDLVVHLKYRMMD